MSTVNATTYQHESGTGSNITLDASGNVVCAADIQSTSQNGGQLAGFRNQLINGDFRIWQRQPSGAGDAGKIILAGKDMYTADRWSTRGPERTGGTTKMSKNTITDLGGSPLIEVAGHTDFFTMTQYIEPEDARGLLGGEATVSFVTDFPDPIITVETYNADGSTNALTVPSPVLSNGRYSTTFTMPSSLTANDSDRGMNVRIYANGLASALPDGSYYVTNFQLEPGPVATPFEHRPIGTELALCQRYFFCLENAEFYATTYARNSSSGDYRIVNFNFPTTMRAAPTVTDTDFTGSADPVNSQSNKYGVSFYKAPRNVTSGTALTAFKANAEL